MTEQDLRGFGASLKAIPTQPTLTPDELKLLDDYRKSPITYRKTIQEVARAGPKTKRSDTDADTGDD